jgi:hypothetical protein
MKKNNLSIFGFGIIRIPLDMPKISANFSILSCFLSIFISNYTFCQKLSPEVISSAGDVSKTASISLEWTLGETIIESSKTINKHYTQGFHQSYLKVMSVTPPNSESLTSDYNMTVFPNPVQAILEVKISTENLPKDEVGKVDLFLIDILGQQLLVQKASEKPGSTFVDMTDFPSGVYFLKAQKENGLLLKSFKIIKIR